MAKKMLIDATHPEETRVVVADGNKVEDFDFEAISKKQIAGNIYLAKVTRVEPSLQAAFVEYGGNRHGFLAFSEIHPDYYQIPKADREALIAEEEAEARKRAKADESRRASRRAAREAAEADEDEDSADDDSADHRDDDVDESNDDVAETGDESGRDSRGESSGDAGSEDEKTTAAEAAPETAPAEKAVTAETADAPAEVAEPSTAEETQVAEAPTSQEADETAPRPEEASDEAATASETGGSDDGDDASNEDDGDGDGDGDENGDGSPKLMAESAGAGDDERVEEDYASAPREDEGQAPQAPAAPVKKTEEETQAEAGAAPTEEAPAAEAQAEEAPVQETSTQETSAETAEAVTEPAPETSADAESAETASEAKVAEETDAPSQDASEQEAADQSAESAEGQDDGDSDSNSDKDGEDGDRRRRRSRRGGRSRRSRRGKARADSAEEATVEARAEEPSDDDDVPAPAPAPESAGGGSDDGDDEGEAISARRIFQRRYKIQEVIKVRQIILVQVVKEERGNKGAALTTYLSLAGRYCVLMPNTARGGGISRKITNAADRKKLKDIAGELEVPKGMGLIIRTAGAKRTKSEINRDYEYLLRQWEQIREITLQSVAPTLIYEEGSLIKRVIRDLYASTIDQIVVDGEEGWREARDYMGMLMPSHARNVVRHRDATPLFAKHGVEQELASLMNPTVQLKSGGYIVIGVTEALVAIDINSGKSTKEGSIEDTALKTNLEAADEISRQLRLRDLAGLIVIDFIDMEDPRNNRAVEKRMKDKLKADRARIQVGRISAFGLMEMSRQRLRPGVLEATTAPCAHCHGTGVVRSDSSLALTILRQIEGEAARGRAPELCVRAPMGAATYLLNDKRDYLGAIEARCGVVLRVEADPTLVSPEFHVERVKTPTRKPTQTPAVTALSVTPPDLEEFEEDDVIEAEVVETPEVEETETEAQAETPEADETARSGSERSSDRDSDRGGADDDGGRRRRGRRGGRRRRRSGDEDARGAEGGEGMTVIEPEAGDSASDEAAETPEAQPKPKRQAKAEAAPVDPEEAAAAEASIPAPKRTRRRRKPKQTEGEAETDTPESQDADAQTPAAAPEAPAPEEAASEEPVAEETAAAQVADVTPEPAETTPDATVETPAAETPAQAEPAPVAEAEAEAEAPRTAAAETSDAEPETAPVTETKPETEAQQAPVPETVAAEPAPEEDNDRPKRRGWWNFNR